MIPASDRKLAVELIEEATEHGARQFMACDELQISERTFQRWKNPSTPLEDQRPCAIRPAPANKLTDEEQEAIVDIATSEKYQSLPPSQIVPRLADEENRYIASESTMYRILKKYDMNHHRGRATKPQKRTASTHKATGPNQVWMWDITWLPGGIKGFFYYLYLILDLYSRKIVSWEIWPEESSENASILVRKAVISENLISRNQPLVLHSDNGSPMKGASLMETLYKLGITSSKSRPRVSNDNPYAESIFKTCKYRPDYPYKGFATIENARQWVLKFAHYYNHEHRHSGLNFLTPIQRHTGMDQTVFSNRRAIYEAAREKNPERWTKSIRDWSLEDEVWLNPENNEKDSTKESTG